LYLRFTFSLGASPILFAFENTFWFVLIMMESVLLYAHIILSYNKISRDFKSLISIFALSTSLSDIKNYNIANLDDRLYFE
jgi:hypothetical protein